VDALLFVHARIAYATMTYMLVVGIWGLVLYFSRSTKVTPSYFGALLIGELIVVIQVLLGGLLLAQGLVPGNPMHYLYGFTALIVLPLAYTYNQGRDDRKALLIYAIIALFVFGAGVRATLTALGAA
jgi:hypothetical protein